MRKYGILDNRRPIAKYFIKKQKAQWQKEDNYVQVLYSSGVNESDFSTVHLILSQTFSDILLSMMLVPKPRKIVERTVSVQ